MRRRGFIDSESFGVCFECGIYAEAYDCDWPGCPRTACRACSVRVGTKDYCRVHIFGIGWRKRPTVRDYRKTFVPPKDPDVDPKDYAIEISEKGAARIYETVELPTPKFRYWWDSDRDETPIG